MFERGDDAQRLRVVIEAAMGLQTGIQRALAGMAERGMTEIMRQGQRLRQVLVQPKLACQRPCDLGNLEGMAEAGAVMVALVKHENLGLVLEPPEGGRINHPVAIPPERAARPARRLAKQPAPARIGIAGVEGPGGSHSNRHDRFNPSS